MQGEISDRIYTMRNEQIMIDRDLSEVNNSRQILCFRLMIMKKMNWSQNATASIV